MAQERRQFVREYKVEAIRLVVREERLVARELAIGRHLLQRWKRELEGAGSAEAFPGNGKLSQPGGGDSTSEARVGAGKAEECGLVKSGG